MPQAASREPPARIKRGASHNQSLPTSRSCSRSLALSLSPALSLAHPPSFSLVLSLAVSLSLTISPPRHLVDSASTCLPLSCLATRGSRAPSTPSINVPTPATLPAAGKAVPRPRGGAPREQLGRVGCAAHLCSLVWRACSAWARGSSRRRTCWCRTTLGLQTRARARAWVCVCVSRTPLLSPTTCARDEAQVQCGAKCGAVRCGAVRRKQMAGAGFSIRTIRRRSFQRLSSWRRCPATSRGCCGRSGRFPSCARVWWWVGGWWWGLARVRVRVRVRACVRVHVCVVVGVGVARVCVRKQTGACSI